MTRKEWLEKFLELADSGAPTVAYRKHLRIMLNDLPPHIKNIGKYRKELAELREQERKRTEELRKKDEEKKRSKPFAKMEKVKEGRQGKDLKDLSDEEG